MHFLLSLLFLMGLPPQKPIEVTIATDHPERHYFQVTTLFPATANEEREVKMAVWTPGSYKVRDFARNLESFQAWTLDDKPLPWQKKDKSTWVVQAYKEQPFKVTYEVFAHEFSVRTSFLDSFYGYINPASVLVYEPSLSQNPFEIKLDLPQGWSVASALQELDSNFFKASNWDTLVDSPIVLGPLRRHHFEINGVPHFWVIAGDVSMNEAEAIVQLQKVGEAVHNVFGGVPFSRYFFFTNFSLEGGGGGLEHANSTLINQASQHMRTKKGWDNFIGVMLHEYVHAWNVKSIRDKALGPFDYQTENYTRLLWLHEGWTSYYSLLLSRRTELKDEDEFLEGLAEDIDRYLKKPATSRQSLADASFDAWIHQYQPGPMGINSRISYYSDGSLSGLTLDLMIRHKTRNKYGLDEVMRRLYHEFAQQGRSITLADVDQIITEVGGTGLANFVEDYILAARPLPLNEALAYAGLELIYKDPLAEEEEEGGDGQTEKKPEKKKPYAPNPKTEMGIRTRTDQGAVFIDFIYRDSAAWGAGLALEDEILAINDRRINEGNFEQILGWSRPGDEIQFTLSRAGHIIKLPVKLEADPGEPALKTLSEKSSLSQEIYSALFSLKPPVEQEASPAEVPGEQKQ